MQTMFVTQNLQWYLLLFHCNLLKYLGYVEELMSLFGIAIATESKFIQWQPHPVTGHSACSLKRNLSSIQSSSSNSSIVPQIKTNKIITAILVWTYDLNWEGLPVFTIWFHHSLLNFRLSCKYKRSTHEQFHQIS